jgi:hypothetical protein
MELLILHLFSSLLLISSIYIQIYSLAPCSKKPSACVFLLMWKTEFRTHTNKKYNFSFERWEENRLWNESWQAFPEYDLFLISL